MGFRGEHAPGFLATHIRERRNEVARLAGEEFANRIQPRIAAYDLVLFNERDNVLAEAAKPPPPLEPPPLLAEIEKVVFGRDDQPLDPEAIAKTFPLFAAARITVEKRKK